MALSLATRDTLILFRIYDLILRGEALGGVVWGGRVGVGDAHHIE